MTATGDGWAIGTDGSRRWGTHGAAGLFLLTRATPEFCAGDHPSTHPNQPPTTPGSPLLLVQHRAAWTNRGGTWALPGGAIDSGESAAQAALRETWEETGVDNTHITIHTEVVTARHPLDHVLRREPLAPEEKPQLEALRPIIARTGDPRAALESHPIIHPNHHGRVVFGLGGEYWWEIPDHSATEWSYTTVIASTPTPLTLHPTHESADLAWWPLHQLQDLDLMPEFSAALPDLLRHLPPHAQ